MNITQKLQNAITNHVQKGQQVPDLTSDIILQELDFTKKDLFFKKVSQSEILSAQNFYENVYYYNILQRNFQKNINTFSLLNFCYSKNLLENEKKEELVSLHLLFLYSTNRLDNFYSSYELLSEKIKNSKQILQIKKFVQFITLGNYIKAISEVGNLSFFHKIVLENINESRKLDTCKIVDLCKNNIEINDIKKLFCISNDKEMMELIKYSNELFEEKKINWKICGDVVFKRKKDSSCLDSDLVIRNMVDLVGELDRII